MRRRRERRVHWTSEGGGEVGRQGGRPIQAARDRCRSLWKIPSTI